jgi:hypothetical protein
MEMVDIGAPALHAPLNRPLEPDGLAELIHGPCATRGFHRPYYLHIASDAACAAASMRPQPGGLGTCPSSLWRRQPALLNAAARNPLVQLFAIGDFEAFIAREFTPWRHLYVDPHHGCAESALVTRIAVEVERLQASAGQAASEQELEQLHLRVAAEYRLGVRSRR